MPQRARSRQSHLKDCRKPSKPQFVGERVGLGELLLDTFSGEWGTEEGESLTPVLRTSNFNEDGSLDYSTPAMQCIPERKVAKKRMVRGDIILEKSGGTPKRPVGIMAFYDSDELALCSNFNQVLRFDEDRILPRFAFHQLRWLKDKNAFDRFTRKTTRLQNLQMKKLIELKLRVPQIEAQTMIADTLDKIVDNQRTLQREIIDLNSLVKSRFIEMFGDPCDPGSSSAKSRIDSFCELRIGPFGSALHKEDYITGGHPLVNPSHIIGGAIRPDENLTIDDGKYESLAAYHLLPSDVVLGRRGEIGRCAVVKTDGLICGTGSMIIRPGQKVRSDYLQRVVSFPSFSHALEANAVSVTMKNLNAKIVGSAEVFLPDLKDQDAFITLVSQIDK